LKSIASNVSDSDSEEKPLEENKANIVDIEEEADVNIYVTAEPGEIIPLAIEGETYYES
jgi:hypothetical protein